MAPAERLRRAALETFMTGQCDPGRKAVPPGEDPGVEAGRRRRAGLIVGIGASAGGPAPLREVAAGLPAGRGLSVFVLQHLDPSAPKNATVEMLAGVCPLRVVDALDGMDTEADCLYVVPPSRHRVRLAEHAGAGFVPLHVTR